MATNLIIYSFGHIHFKSHEVASNFYHMMRKKRVDFPYCRGKVHFSPALNDNGERVVYNKNEKVSASILMMKYYMHLT
jgi:hypothetical protein